MKTTKSLFALLATLIFLNSCDTSKNNYTYSNFTSQRVSDFAPDFKNYCGLDLATSFELNAVEASSFGDYQTALDQATKREAISMSPSESFSQAGGGMDKAQLISALQAELSNPSTKAADKASAQTFLDLISTPDPPFLRRPSQYQPYLI